MVYEYVYLLLLIEHGHITIISFKNYKQYETKYHTLYIFVGLDASF